MLPPGYFPVFTVLGKQVCKFDTVMLSFHHVTRWVTLLSALPLTIIRVLWYAKEFESALEDALPAQCMIRPVAHW